MKRITLSALACILSVAGAFAQNKAQTYFVDGFHGGVYGHFPANYTSYMVELLDSVPDWKIGLEIEPVTWDLVAVNDPVAYRRFRDHLIDGSRVEYTNPAFGQPYMYNISGESMIRQMKYGSDVLRRHFPGLRLDMYAVAEPCFTSSLPTVLSSLGFKYVTTKCPDTLFGGWFGQRGSEVEWWTGPDGESRLLNSPRSLCAVLDSFCAWSSLEHSMTKEFVDAAFAEGLEHPIGMTYQDAGWRIGPWLQAQHVDEGPTVTGPDYADPEYILWSDYFERVAPMDKETEGTYSQEDMHPVLVWGGQELQRTARKVRHLENRIVATEKLAAIAQLAAGGSYPSEDLRLAWEGLLLSQHHDCWICCGKRWERHVNDWASNSECQCTKVQDGARKALATPDESAVTVFNTTGFRRSGRVAVAVADSRFAGVADGDGRPAPSQCIGVVDGDGRPAPSQCIGVVDGDGRPAPSQMVADSLYFIADVPGFGWRTYRLCAEQPGGKSAGNGRDSGLQAGKVQQPGGKSVTGIRKKGRNIMLYNDLMEITFDAAKGGAIVSIKDRKSGCELVDCRRGMPFNGLRAYYPEAGEYHSSDETPATVGVVCTGPVFSTVEVRGNINGTAFTQTVTLTAGDPTVDCVLTVDWQGKAPLIGSHEPEDGDRYDRSGNRLSWRLPFYDGRHKMNLLFPIKEAGTIAGKGAAAGKAEMALGKGLAAGKAGEVSGKGLAAGKAGMALGKGLVAGKAETVSGKARRIVKDAPFDVCESRLKDTYFDSFDSLKHNVILNWVDLETASGSLALLSDQTTAYVYGPDHPLGLTVQYVGSGFGHSIYQVDRPTEMHYAFVPHGGAWAGTMTGGGAWKGAAAGAMNGGAWKGAAARAMNGGAWKGAAARAMNGGAWKGAAASAMTGSGAWDTDGLQELCQCWQEPLVVVAGGRVAAGCGDGVVAGGGNGVAAGGGNGVAAGCGDGAAGGSVLSGCDGASPLLSESASLLSSESASLLSSESASLLPSECASLLSSESASLLPSECASLLSLDGTGYQLVTAYFEDGDLYVRLYNASGDASPRVLQPGFSWQSAALVELDGRIREALPARGPLTLSIPRFGLRTVKFCIPGTPRQYR